MDKDVIKTFVGSVSSLFQELPECTVDEEMEWRPFKVALASSARLCGRELLGVMNNGIIAPLVGPRGERCNLSKESSLQGLASEQSLLFLAFAVSRSGNVRSTRDEKV